MGAEILRFADIEIGKNKFYCYKTSIFFKKDADIEKVLVCNKFFLEEKIYKYFIGYLYIDDRVKSLHVS